MMVKVQSRHLLDESLLVIIWRLSTDEESFQDWKRNPQTKLGQIDDDFYFWMNWLETNRGLLPVISLETTGYPAKQDDWRVLIELADKEKDFVSVFHENNLSVYVYFNNELTRFRLIYGKNEPRVEKTKPEEPPWLTNKIAAIKEERSPEALAGRLNNLKTRLEQLKQRRD